jgi:cation transport ATPase
MVGDGINEAPSLTEANVASPWFRERKSPPRVATFCLANDLAKFTEMLQIARSTRCIIWENFYGTIAVDFMGIGLSTAGILVLCSRQLFTYLRNDVHIEPGPGCCRASSAAAGMSELR